jgi:hypothetical protein
MKVNLISENKDYNLTLIQAFNDNLVGLFPEKYFIKKLIYFFV